MLLGARGNAAELLPEAAAYLRGLAFGTLPLVLCVTFASALQLDSSGRLIRIAAMCGMAVDIILDVVFAKIGLGLFGMGLASSISCFVNFGVLLLHFTNKNRMLHFKFKHLPWSSLLEIVSCGSDKIARRTANIIRPLILNTLIISAGGTLGMSALSIRNNIADFLEIPISGIAGATATLIGIAYGEKNKEDCIHISKLAHLYTYICTAATCVLIAFSAKPLAAYYVPQAGELRQLVFFALCMFCIQSFFTALVSCRLSYLQSIHRTKENFVVTMFSRLLAVTICAALLVKPFGAKGVIVAFTLGNVLICLGIILYHWIGNKGKFPRMDDYMLLPDAFEVLPQNTIDLTVNNENEVSMLAHQLLLFYKGHKFDEKIAVHAALCVEEVTLNIIRHGFTKVKNPQPIDVRILIVDDELTIRIRDYCPNFDLSKRIALIQGNTDPNYCPGIKIIAAMTKKVEYVNLMETNTLIMTIPTKG